MAFPGSEGLVIDFGANLKFTNWSIIDDRVMGGRSYGNFEINDEGHGMFYGDVSTENNGGFSSVRFLFETKDISDYENVVVKLKGDGKVYQLRVKSNRMDRESYVQSFQTSGEWEEISIPLRDLKPTWRGMSLNIPNYNAKAFQELGILVGNKRDESFAMEIDYITLR